MGTSITKQGIATASGNINPNLISKYISASQYAPGNTSSGARTQYYGDYGIIIPAIESGDTYFSIYLKQELSLNTVYTISCYVSGLVDGSYYNFPLFAQANTAMGILKLDHNGLCSLTFTMTYGTQTPITYKDETYYRCLMDDYARSIASGQGAITVKNFKMEIGSIVTPWVPADNDPIYVGGTCGFNELVSTSASIAKECISAPQFYEL